MPVPLSPELAQVVSVTKGFMPDVEAAALYDAAVSAEPGVWLEIGTYCGKSTVVLGGAAREVGATVVTVDHHRGSEETKSGGSGTTMRLWSIQTRDNLDTLPSLRQTLRLTQLEDVVNPVVASTQSVGSWWSTPVQFLFLDGNHTEEVAQHDYQVFARHVVDGGILAFTTCSRTG